MKRLIITGGVLILFLSAQVIFAQGDCKVLMSGIDKIYNGSCKRGLAEGQGEASGMDHYKGNFRKGFPDGKGTYFWKTGEIYKGNWKLGLRDGEGEYTFKYLGRDSVMTGFWKDDKFAGGQVLPPYVIEYRYSIGRVSCIRMGDRPYVKFQFSRAGSMLNDITNLLLQGSSGSEINTVSFTGFDQATFPFKGKVTFTAPSSLGVATLTCELRLTINQPGSWIVTMYY